MTTLVAIGGVVSTLISTVSGVVVNRRTSMAANRRLQAEMEQARAAVAATRSEAQNAAQDAMATLAERMAITSCGMIDRLQADIEQCRAQSAAVKLACEQRIAELELQVGALRDELAESRGGGMWRE